MNQALWNSAMVTGNEVAEGPTSPEPLGKASCTWNCATSAPSTTCLLVTSSGRVRLSSILKFKKNAVPVDTPPVFSRHSTRTVVKSNLEKADLTLSMTELPARRYHDSRRKQC